MTKFWISFMLLLCMGSYCLAAEQKIEAPSDCKQCGMNRTAFAHSRMVVTYTDGSSSGTCSLNCVVTDSRDAMGKSIKSFQVADYNTKTLIDAQSATWVIGGKKSGVMTSVAKWAFAGRQDAEAFIKVNGGKLATFDDALKATEKELDGESQPMMHNEHGCGCGHKM